MMKTVFFLLIITGTVAALISGRPELVMTVFVESSGAAVSRCLGLLGILSVWLGLAKIAEKSGFLNYCGKFLSPLLSHLFPSVPRNHSALNYISMNLSANMLGFGSAATPFGLKAMKELQKLNGYKKSASEAMCTFLAVNTSSVTLIPTTMIAIRTSLGSIKPESIIITTLAATVASTAAAVTLDFYFRRRNRL